MNVQDIGQLADYMRSSGRPWGKLDEWWKLDELIEPVEELVDRVGRPVQVIFRDNYCKGIYATFHTDVAEAFVVRKREWFKWGIVTLVYQRVCLTGKESNGS